MNQKYTLKKLMRDKKAKGQKILAGCVKGEEVRDMSEDEKAQFDAVMADVQAIKDQLEKLDGLDDEDRDEDEDDSKPEQDEEKEPRSRRSYPFEERTAPAVHTKKHRYSILKAMRQNLENEPLTGLEGEISREIERRNGKKARGFYLPMGNEDFLEHRTDLTTSTGTGAVFVVPELPFIELLRNKLILTKLGVTFLTGMDGKFAIPRQSGAAAASWVTEGSGVTATSQSLDSVAFVDKTLAAATNYSRKFLFQSSIDAESFVKNDLAKQCAIALEGAGINGSGSGATPVGILQNSTIQSNSSTLALGQSGGVPTYGSLINMETRVSNANADIPSMGYLTSPAGRGTLKQTAKIGTTFPNYLWENDSYDSNNVPVGTVNGYQAYATNNVPSNLTKGSSTGLSGIIFGNWSDLVIAQWGGIDVLVNPYTGQLSGAVTISLFLEADVQVRHPESFAIISDMQTVAF